MTDYFYAWAGQNATTGNANPRTGRLSMFGQLFKFKSRIERDKYVDEYYSSNPSEYAVKVNKQSARQYRLGMSVSAYEEYLEMAPVLYWVDEENRWVAA